MTSTATLAFEIGTEEIPAFDLKRATEQLAELVPASLDAVRIPHGDVAIYTSPRRLIAIVDAVADQTEALEEVFRGPAAKIAFDEAGAPTKAAIGFARGKGLDVDALERRDENGTEYVYAVRSVAAQPVAALLPEVLRGIIDGISWPKSCRWGTTREMFSRPVRWLVALLGDEVIPVQYAGLVAGNTTRGHRFLAPGPHTVPCADELVSVVEGAYVVPTQAAREARIRAGVAAAEAATGYAAELPAKTLTEVINLSEYPTVMVGTFDEEFLKVPEEIIVDAMLMHQRYFPLYDGGKLTNKFIIVSNGDPEREATIVDGNERVVAARLYDAKFFYEEDLKQPLDAYVERLDEVVFQEALGTMRDKTERVVKLSARLTAAAGIAREEMHDIARAAYLAKADLVTAAVIEFTSVQGVMGSYYATAAGEPERVARAIAEHYRPRFSGDAIPTDVVGQVVALADKLDTICGLFAVGASPTGSSDPFALRRAALGVLAILETGLPIDLVEAIDAALIIYREAGLQFDNAAVRREIIDFFITREKVALRDAGVKADTIDAVLACGIEEPMVLAARARAVEAARTEQPEVFADLATAFARANNLRDVKLGTGYKKAELSEVECALSEAVVAAEEAVAAALREDRFADALVALAALRAPVDRFFETTMVMDDDPEVRANRLKLLNRFANAFAHVADFGAMAKK
ncbi:glycine--tRNA ligase subunit beta [Adlercreutzia muris]|uniref:Glycine--tRNA ligase beta subunit n=1 Tax=Adlercreutzia muris TaxID=1796610 RepID=A0A7C8FSD6_9ACTN|nr:glycine--tRNA ligase subunit beta [Adlercreutzia muris]KAB1638705.1 glycine--tRNA ligase subunit beta [Adlercreutzia muris]MCR2027354.1 glycine--tRNA ligase subunit beta [Adlercreutzia muris]MCU7585574.1 glycine--tRNA ligase subunit beta [Adlercreutzia muris]